MQLSDVLYTKSTVEIIFPPDPIDPSYFLDLKEHLDKNQEYRKARIEWRKSKPSLWDLRRAKEEYFQVFCQEDLPTFNDDITRFLAINQELSISEAAKKFCDKWRGYSNTYGIEFVERAMRRSNHE